MRFLPLCGCVSTTVWLHHLNSNEMVWEKARDELHKKAEDAALLAGWS